MEKIKRIYNRDFYISVGDFAFDNWFIDNIIKDISSTIDELVVYIKNSKTGMLVRWKVIRAIEYCLEYEVEE